METFLIKPADANIAAKFGAAISSIPPQAQMLMRKTFLGQQHLMLVDPQDGPWDLQSLQAEVSNLGLDIWPINLNWLNSIFPVGVSLTATSLGPLTSCLAEIAIRRDQIVDLWSPETLVNFVMYACHEKTGKPGIYDGHYLEMIIGDKTLNAISHTQKCLAAYCLLLGENSWKANLFYIHAESYLVKLTTAK